MISNKDDQEILTYIQVLPISLFNLISTTYMIKLGYKMENKCNSITFGKGNFVLQCNKKENYLQCI